MPDEQPKDEAEEPEESPPPPRGEQGPYLMRAWLHLSGAHDALTDAADHVGHNYESDKNLQSMLAAAHDHVVSCRDYIDQHRGSAERAKQTAQSTLGMMGAFFSGSVLGHVLSTPQEPKPGGILGGLLDSLSPETKAAMMSGLEQGVAALTSYFRSQKTAAAGPSPTDGPPPPAEPGPVRAGR